MDGGTSSSRDGARQVSVMGGPVMRSTQRNGPDGPRARPTASATVGIRLQFATVDGPCPAPPADGSIDSMSKSSTSVRFAAVGDIHVTKDSAGTLRGFFAKAADSADALLLC